MKLRATAALALQRPLNCSMTSKKPAASKRAPLPRAADYAKSFFKDWERLSRAGRYDMTRLKEAMLLLIAKTANSGLSGLITRSAAIGRGTASVTSAGTSCWRTNLMTAGTMAWWSSCAPARTPICSSSYVRAVRWGNVPVFPQGPRPRRAVQVHGPHSRPHRRRGGGLDRGMRRRGLRRDPGHPYPTQA